MTISEDKRETIDLETWHEVCERRDSGQPLDFEAERRPKPPSSAFAPIQASAKAYEERWIRPQVGVVKWRFLVLIGAVLLGLWLTLLYLPFALWR